MTSRSASRNAMTQVEEEHRHRATSPAPGRGYIEISGRESRAASRAEMRPSMTAPNLNEYTEDQQQQQQRRLSYSRHYNGHHRSASHRPSNGYVENESSGRGLNRPSNGYIENESSGRERGLRNSSSLNLLPLARDANYISFRDKYNRPGSDWNLTTTKRTYRYMVVF